MAQSRFLLPLVLLVGVAGLLLPELLAGCNALSSVSTQPAKVPHPSAVMMSMIPPASQLKIVKARYGAKGSWTDLTDKLNQRIRDNRLVVQAANDLAGDPLFGTPKRLEVEYILDDQPGKASIQEGDSLSLPPFVWTRQRLLDFVGQCPAQVSLFGRNFTSGAAIEHNGDRPVCLASIVKVFDLLEVMRQVDEGKIRLADPIVIPRKEGDKTCSIREALDLMIGLSDNDATNAIARLVGYDNVNVLPGQLGIEGLSDQVMPRPGLLDKALDQRVAGGPTSQPALLPQHGSMRALVRFFELLHKDQLLTPRISQATMEVFQRNPMPYVSCLPASASIVGKGGSVGWVRPFKTPYNMGGWALYIRDGKQAMGLAVAAEWWPDGTPGDLQFAWCQAISNGLVMVLEQGPDTQASQPVADRHGQ